MNKSLTINYDSFLYIFKKFTINFHQSMHLFSHPYSCFLYPLLKGIASPIQIEIWDFPRWLEPGEKVDRFKWISRKILEFEQKNPDIKVKLTKLTWKRGGEKLKISALGGSHPDVATGHRFRFFS